MREIIAAGRYNHPPVNKSALIVLAVLSGLIACSCSRQAAPPDGPRTLAVLTRGGCVNTDQMRANLDDAIKTFSKPISYEMVDLDTLPRTDPRSGYPTPTMLYQGRDVFGMPVPQPPYLEPT